MPKASGLRRPVVISFFLLVGGIQLLGRCSGVHAIKELQPPRPLPPLTTILPRIFGGPPLHSTTVTVPPVFKQENNTELHSQVGTTAVLHCATDHIGENTVSWVRRRDYHLLTVGLVAYSTDQRFSVRYVKNENDWQLHIRYVQKRDEGVYECQIATHPPISLLSTLHVVEATSEILGGPEKYMTMGSSLRLVCVLRKNTQPPTYVFWYHNDRMINYDTKVKVDTGGEVSVLFLGEVGPQSSGNYTCMPSNAQSSHIIVHVLRGGETPAAIHSGSSSATVLPGSLTRPLLFSLADLEQEEKPRRTRQKCQGVQGIGSSSNLLHAVGPSRPAESSPCLRALGDVVCSSAERRIRGCRDVSFPTKNVFYLANASSLKDVLALTNVIRNFVFAYCPIITWAFACVSLMMSLILDVFYCTLKITIPLAVFLLQNWSTKCLYLQNTSKIRSLYPDNTHLRAERTDSSDGKTKEKEMQMNNFKNNHMYKKIENNAFLFMEGADDASKHESQDALPPMKTWESKDSLREAMSCQQMCAMMKSIEEIHSSSHRKKYPKFN
ncbi:Immunoglobulin V-set domain [Trinorchestia longiramus]|nr:Immunoglobulin V-set domain [Trinorchestia longiramus]